MNIPMFSKNNKITGNEVAVYRFLLDQAKNGGDPEKAKLKIFSKQLVTKIGFSRFFNYGKDNKHIEYEMNDSAIAIATETVAQGGFERLRFGGYSSEDFSTASARKLTGLIRNEFVELLPYDL
jgi:hypothetical protein